MENGKLINLNIEGDRHLERVTEFLKSEDPDIVCLQEVLSKDVEYFKNLLNMDGEYAPTGYIKDENKLLLTPGNAWGVMMLTKLEPVKFTSHYYAGSPQDLPNFKDDYHNSDCRVLVVMEHKTGEESFAIATTHFTWSEGGTTSDLQREHLQKMLDFLSPYDNLLLCGDFNAPRGLEIWGELSKRYADNIPPDITTTIDQELHRVKGIQYVVDGVFSTARFELKDVEVKSGLSDHMAIVSNVLFKNSGSS